MNQVISTTPTQWFWRGFLVGVLVIATLNAGSYFVRSDGWGNLLGTTPAHREAIGFPFELWESGNLYGGYFVDYYALLFNGILAAGIGVICGSVVWCYRRPLTRMVHEFEQLADDKRSSNPQISLRGILVGIVLAAILAAVARYALARRPESLAVIYVLGPWILVLIALLPLGLAWQTRVAILIPAALLMMAGAVLVGARLEPPLEFDQVLLAISVCWIPQTALAAIGLTGWLVLDHARVKRRESRVS